MQIFLAAAVTVLAVSTPAQPQSPSQALNQPITITFINTVTVEQALSTMAKLSGLVLEISEVPEDVRRQRLSPSSTISLRNVTIERALQQFTEMKGLAFVVVESKTLVVFTKP